LSWGTWLANLRDRALCVKKFYRSMVTDITERNKIEELLKKHLTELEAANKDLESFSYSVFA
jgi:hypothetical protein